jgi:hypothetical protein
VRSAFLSSDTAYEICEVGEMYAWRTDSDAFATSFPIRDFISSIPAFDFHLQMTQNRGGGGAERQNSTGEASREVAKTSYASIRKAGQNMKFFLSVVPKQRKNLMTSISYP